MANISVFNFLTVNGFYKGANEDISWHKHQEQEGEFAATSLQADNILLFGRTTFEMMAGYWPTPMAIEQNGKIAEGMNTSEKIVFSNSLKNTDWNNSKIIGGDIIAAAKQLKETSTKDMTILGSGTIVSQFADAGLIDTYMLMIDPVAIGKGTPLFKDMKRQLDLELIDNKVFNTGVILLVYKPKI